MLNWSPIGTSSCATRAGVSPPVHCYICCPGGFRCDWDSLQNFCRRRRRKRRRKRSNNTSKLAHRPRIFSLYYVEQWTTRYALNVCAQTRLVNVVADEIFFCDTGNQFCTSKRIWSTSGLVDQFVLNVGGHGGPE